MPWCRYGFPEYSCDLRENKDLTNSHPESIMDSKKPSQTSSRLMAIDDYIKSLYLDTANCDFSIVTKDSTFSVHLVVLSATCHYFRYLTRSPFKEASEKKVFFPDISSSIMQFIIKFCYTGECLEKKENFCELVLSGSKLQNNELLEICQQRASKYVDENNFWKLFALGKSCELRKLCEVAAEYCAGNLDLVVGGLNLIKIDYEDLLSILKFIRPFEHTHLNVKTEQLIFKAVISWIEADEQRRAINLDEIFKYIHFERTGRGFLAVELARLVYKNNQQDSEQNLKELDAID